MPAIIIKDYTWRQTPEFIILNIPLRGHPKKVDLFVTDNYLKVSNSVSFLFKFYSHTENKLYNSLFYIKIDQFPTLYIRIISLG